jgi:copper chaperone CopZ
MCKKRIERDLGVSKGIINSNLDLTDKVVTIKYNTKKTSPEKIKEVISKIGYDADEVIADQKSHAALPDCCQKTAEGHKD